MSPHHSKIFRPFELISLNDVNVVMIGQNPYASLHYEATGIPFEVEPGYKSIPPTVKTICEELERSYDVQIDMPDFRYWISQGVLMINSSLTIGYSSIKDHEHTNDIHFGLWSFFIRNLIEYMCKKKDFLIFVLMGNRAESFTSNVRKDKNNFTTLVTPFPLGNRGGKGSFVGCNMFKKCNELLVKRGIKEIEWFGHTEV